MRPFVGRLLFLLSFLVFRVAAAEPAQVMELKQFEAGAIFFRPSAEPLCFARVDGRYRTNALAVGQSPLFGSMGTTTWSMVEGWLDSKGHVHTVGVLKRQLAFISTYLGWLRERGAPVPGVCDFDGCHLGPGWSTPVFVRSVAPTGALDRDTLLIQFFTLALRWETLSERAAAIPTQEPLRGFLAEKLASAREAILAVRAAGAFPLERPTPPAAGATRRSPGGLSAGLKIRVQDLPAFVDRTALGAKPECYRRKSEPNSAEAAIEESVDPNASGFPARVQALYEAERAAETELETAELIAAVLLRPK